MSADKATPLESFFDIEPKSKDPLRDMIDSDDIDTISGTAVSTTDASNQMIPYESTIDDEDKAIAKQLQSVFDKAIDVFHSQQELVEIVDPKFAARNAEVAALYLNTALSATALRAKIKDTKDKSRGTTSGSTVVNGNVNNVFVGNRNDLLKMLNEKDAEKDAEKDVFDQEPSKDE